MKSLFDTIEVLGTLETARGTCELCAAANAEYNPEALKLEVKLDAFLRTTDLRSAEQRFAEAWLPKPELVRESVEQAEAVEMARDIFHSWVRKVKERAPALAQH